MKEDVKSKRGSKTEGKRGSKRGSKMKGRGSKKKDSKGKQLAVPGGGAGK